MGVQAQLTQKILILFFKLQRRSSSVVVSIPMEIKIFQEDGGPIAFSYGNIETYTTCDFQVVVQTPSPWPYGSAHVFYTVPFGFFFSTHRQYVIMKIRQIFFKYTLLSGGLNIFLLNSTQKTFVVILTQKISLSNFLQPTTIIENP